MALGELACESRQWCDVLWEELVFDSGLTEELVFLFGTSLSDGQGAL